VQAGGFSSESGVTLTLSAIFGVRAWFYTFPPDGVVTQDHN
jgi:hypothetical protein